MYALAGMVFWHLGSTYTHTTIYTHIFAGFDRPETGIGLFNHSSLTLGQAAVFYSKLPEDPARKFSVGGDSRLNGPGLPL